jgi:hypothetical protein
MAAPTWERMMPEQKIEALRADVLRLFDLTNQYEGEIEKLKTRVSRLEAWAETQG